MGVDPAILGRALAARLADVAAAAARYDAFAFTERPASASDGGRGGDPAAVARDLALAALRAAGEPLAYAMLRRMAGADAALADLGADTGLPRLAVWERINGLVAAGLGPGVWAGALELAATAVGARDSALAALVRGACFAAVYLPTVAPLGRGLGLGTLAREWMRARAPSGTRL